MPTPLFCTILTHYHSLTPIDLYLSKFDSVIQVLNNIDSVKNSESFNCKPESVSNILSKYNHKLTILSQNIRSVSANLPQLEVLLARIGYDLDFIVLTECWLAVNPHIPHLNGYLSYNSTNNNNQNEGVVVYVKQTLSNILVETPSFSDANCILIKISNHTLIIAIYRSPSYKSISNFLDSLNSLISKHSNFQNIVLVGDINIDIIEEHLDERCPNYLELLAYHELLPAHNFPTRVPTLTCLDHLIVKSKRPSTAMVLDTFITDHAPIMLALSTNHKPITRPVTKLVTDYASLSRDIENLDLTPVLTSNDTEFAATSLVNSLTNCIDKNSKLVTPSKRKSIIKPWITPGLLRCMRNRDKLHKKLKRNPSNNILLTTYKRYRNFLTTLLKKLKHLHEKQLLINAGKNPKKIWESIRMITNSHKPHSSSEELLEIGTPPLNSVNKINSYFSGVGETLAKKIPPPLPTSPSTTLPIWTKSLVINYTDEDEIMKLIDSLKDDTAMGWDNIPSSLIKKHKSKLTPAIVHICNLSIEHGVFPNVFKTALVYPIHKAGKKDQMENYRPISILPALSKILERILNKRLIHYLEKNNLLSENQFGFRTGRSTSQAVDTLTSLITDALDSGQKCLTVYLDFAKAFDSVSIPRLLSKLEALGVRGTQLNLFRSYLTDRNQLVKIGPHVSADCPVHFGVPQGSILGPSLFLVYINDLTNLKLVNGNVLSFADDTALVFIGDSWPEVFKSAQLGLNRVNQWLAENILTLNTTKSSYMIYSMRNINLPSTGTHKIFSHNFSSPLCESLACGCPALERVTTVKYLGVTIDSNMTFQQHISLLSSRVRKLIYIFKLLRPVADMKVLKMTYKALCQSIITYCITSWGGAAVTNLITLERAQRAVLKVSAFKPFRYPTSDLYNEWQVLTVRQLFILSTVLKFHSTLTYHPDILGRNNRLKLSFPKYNTMFSNRFFGFIGHFLYKNLNAKLSIVALTKFSCKKIVTNWLLHCSYEETENMLHPLV